RLGKAEIVPVVERVLVVHLEDDPQRNRHDRQEQELRWGIVHPRSPPPLPRDAVGEEDEARPRNRGVPRIERFDLREHARFRDRHDREADPGPPGELASALESKGCGGRGSDHVNRPDASPTSDGRPRFFAKAITFIVLPSPPGRISVLAARRRAIDAVSEPAGIRSVRPRPTRKYVWSTQPRSSKPAERAADRMAVRSTCTVRS